MRALRAPCAPRHALPPHWQNVGRFARMAYPCHFRCVPPRFGSCPCLRPHRLASGLLFYALQSVHGPAQTRALVRHRLGERLSVNLTPVANLHHQYAQSAVLNVTNHPAIAHPVAPKSTVRTGQSLARVAWVFQTGYAFVHEVNNAPSSLFIELAQLTFGRVGIFNCPSQGLVSHRQRNAPVLFHREHAQAHRQRGSSPPFLGCPVQSFRAGRKPWCSPSGMRGSQAFARFLEPNEWK